MIGRAASTRCRICRTLGVLPAFLLACIVAWLATSATGWVWGILAFVIVLVCGILSVRAGCQLVFPDNPVVTADQYADPHEFAPQAAVLDIEDMAPGDLETSSGIDRDDTLLLEPDEPRQNVGADIMPLKNTNIFEAKSPEQNDPDDIDQFTASVLEEVDDVTEEVFEDEETPADFEGFDLKQDEQTAPSFFETQPQLDEEPKSEDIQAHDVNAPGAISQVPSAATNDPGRRLAQNLVMVGASPALSRTPSSNPTSSLRPASLRSARASGPDDLKLIRGVGDALEELLHALGYYHFDQIAQWSPEEVAWVDNNIAGFKGRVSRDQWVTQATLLAQSHGKVDPDAQSAPNLRPLSTNKHNSLD